MSIFPIRCRAGGVLSLVVALAASTEPRGAERARTAPTPALEARLELSDSTARSGTDVRIVVRLAGKAATGVASVTARLGYDTTAFRFVGDEPLADGATRVINPSSGLLRFAAVAPNGFPEGQVYAMRFTVIRAVAAESFRLTVDEMHTTSRADAMAALSPEKP